MIQQKLNLDHIYSYGLWLPPLVSADSSYTLPFLLFATMTLLNLENMQIRNDRFIFIFGTILWIKWKKKRLPHGNV